ncbi:hypothetical protein M408DRAFT_232428 [Serendipita vermifera MAFF 305830]|uniref:Uncharacterized protein n=1 Tax=Serendipita vermifera MAFF 305830 TaxID=933852 RepID=A0A0C2X5C1_SERVB|nr:hypothetical protein M408DRAFT_232428 [Serendipita vermifera MAFF 305830]
MLVTSLSHIEELSGLIAKAYAMIAMESEMEKGEVMMQIMRADFVTLNRILEDTAVEVNWSAYSMEDYRSIIKHTLGLQRCMFRGFNALALFSLEDKQILSRVVIPQTRHLVFRIRTDISKIIGEISNELGGKAHGNPPMRAGYEELISVERDAAKLRRQFVGRQPGQTEDDDTSSEGPKNDGNMPSDVEKNLASLTHEFLNEVDPERDASASPLPADELPNNLGFLPEPADPSDSIQRLKRDFIAIQKVQADIMHSILTVVHPREGEEEMALRMEERLPSLRERWGLHSRRGGARHTGVIPPRQSVSRSRQRSSISRGGEPVEVPGGPEEENRGRQTKRVVPSVELQEDQTSMVESSDLVKLSRALATVYSLHFSTQTVIEELSDLCNVIKPHDGKKRSKRLHVHLFPARSQHPNRGNTSTRVSSMFNRETEDEHQLSVKEAMAMLEDKKFTPTVPTFWQRVDAINQFFKTDQSMYAIKAAAISSVFVILFIAPVTRGWFNSFAVQASLLSALVAFEPTIGQSRR